MSFPITVRALICVILLSTSFATASIGLARTSIAPYPPNPTLPLPIPCTGEGCTTFRDSFLDHTIIQRISDGIFFRISTSRSFGNGLALATAPALEGPWARGTPVLDDYSQLRDYDVSHTNDSILWTPELAFNGSMYFLYYALNDRDATNSYDIRVAMSPNMEDNTWTDYGSLDLPQPPIWKTYYPNGTVAFHNNEYALIDGSVLKDYSSGIMSNFIVFGDQNSGIFGSKLSASGLSAVGTPVQYIQDTPRGFAPNGGQHTCNMTGLSYLVAMNGYVYNFYSSGSCCEPEAIYNFWTGVCRSSTTKPYTFFDKNGLPCAGGPNGTINNSGSTFLYGNFSQNAQGKYQVSGPGSIGIVKTSTGPVITYQYRNESNSGTVMFGHNFLNFTSDGWPYLSAAARGNNVGL